jgi:hypothetical protein
MGNCLKISTQPNAGGGNNKEEKGNDKIQNNKKKDTTVNNSNRATNNSKPVWSDRLSKAKSSHLSNPSNGASVHGGILREQSIDVYKKYVQIEVLGNGSMGHVAKVAVRDQVERGISYRTSQSNVMNRSTDHPDDVVDLEGHEKRKHMVEYALKSIQLESVTPSFVDELKNEIDILNTMDHPNIIRLHEVYYHRRQIYLILELCDGGDLYTRLPYSEKDAAYITGKLLTAVTYMHDHGIVHRDCEYKKYRLVRFVDDGWVFLCVIPTCAAD